MKKLLIGLGIILGLAFIFFASVSLYNSPTARRFKYVEDFYDRIRGDQLYALNDLVDHNEYLAPDRIKSYLSKQSYSKQYGSQLDNDIYCSNSIHDHVYTIINKHNVGYVKLNTPVIAPLDEGSLGLLMQYLSQQDALCVQIDTETWGAPVLHNAFFFDEELKIYIKK